MNRQIKFRVIVDGKIYGFQWIDERGFWCWCYADNQDQWEYGIIDYSLLGDGFTGGIKWEQFTGLTDKNGVEIYEGDIVKSLRFEFVCKWEGAGFKFVKIGEHAVMGWATSQTKSLKVIGNIHENPELSKT